jgi:dTDP-4-amino-4,6-dideoxygalactose transaminase
MKKPAILGGIPSFDKTLSINKPTLPPVSKLTHELEEIFATGMLTNSKYVKLLEEKCADYLATKHAVAVSCCTSGLILTIKTMGLTGEIIVPSFTFPATVHSLLWNNLTPIFIDCDPETFNLDTELIEEKISQKTSGILAVYIFGNPPEMERLEEIASKYGLKLFFDAAHAFGSKFKGKTAGNFGDAEIFSLAPTKVIVSGEGGIVATDNDSLASKLKIAREYGNPGNYDCQMIGLNARMSEFHALVGLKCLETLDENIEKRYRLVEKYKSELRDIPGISFQKISPDSRTTYNYFSILVNEKEFGLTNDELAIALWKENLMTRKYFFPPVHKQAAYSDYFGQYKDKLPVTESVCRKICCLPLFSHIEEETVIKICRAIQDIYKDRIAVKKRIMEEASKEVTWDAGLVSHLSFGATS